MIQDGRRSSRRGRGEHPEKGKREEGEEEERSNGKGKGSKGDVEDAAEIWSGSSGRVPLYIPFYRFSGEEREKDRETERERERERERGRERGRYGQPRR